MHRDATDILADIASGRTSARVATDACLSRIAAREPAIHAWAHLDPARAEPAADACDAAPARGPLHGLPIGIKDVIQTRDMPTRYNCAAYADAGPTPDAACVRLLRQAGAVIVGKTATVELAAIGAPPPTRNPHAPDHTPGGSSSGSAAAVADGHVPLALGTQTGGSIVRPASFCGAWAIKPTWGTVSTEGVKPFAPSLDTVGWFAAACRDLLLPLDVFRPAPAHPLPALRGARIGIWRTAAWDRAGAETRAAFAAAIARCEAAGARTTELAPPPPLDALADVHRAIMLYEGGYAFLPDVLAAADRLSPRIVDMVRTACATPESVMRAHYATAEEARARFDTLAAEHDAILMPSAIGPAPRGLDATGDLIFNGLLTLLHVPVVNLPLYRAGVLPVGVSLTGRRFADRSVIALACQIADVTRSGRASRQEPAA